jgi:glycosyltransferase involved in cell wall biosynthesis
VVVVHGPSCAAQYRRATGDRPQRLLLSTHGLILEPDRVEPPPVAQPLRLLFFGRMESYKGVEVLLDAVSILHRDAVEFSLTVAGRGPELDRLSARFAQIPQVHVINRYVDSPELIRLVQESECVVLPYLGATQSGVLAAAYAGRRYVVASATGGLVDVVSHRSNGILVSPGDARDLADAIRSLAGDVDLRERLLRGAEVTAATTLNWARIAAGVHDALIPWRAGDFAEPLRGEERCGR